MRGDEIRIHFERVFEWNQSGTKIMLFDESLPKTYKACGERRFEFSYRAVLAHGNIEVLLFLGLPGGIPVLRRGWRDGLQCHPQRKYGSNQCRMNHGRSGSRISRNWSAATLFNT